MSRFREIPCMYYICKHECTKGKDADYRGLCQHCDVYKPRAKERILNKKKQYLDKLKRNDKGEY